MKQAEKNKIIDILTDYTDWLLKECYVDADVYAEYPTAVDGYMSEKYPIESLIQYEETNTNNH